MQVLIKKKIILIIHKGEGTRVQARFLINEMRRMMHILKKENSVVGVYHDVTHLNSVENAYVTMFAGLAKEWGNQGIVYVATIPKSWIRVMAMSASTLGGIETHFFKTDAESLAFLRAKGFEVNDDSFRAAARAVLRADEPVQATL